MFEHMQQLEPKNIAAYEKNVHEEQSIEDTEGPTFFLNGALSGSIKVLISKT